MKPRSTARRARSSATTRPSSGRCLRRARSPAVRAPGRDITAWRQPLDFASHAVPPDSLMTPGEYVAEQADLPANRPLGTILTVASLPRCNRTTFQPPIYIPPSLYIPGKKNIRCTHHIRRVRAHVSRLFACA